MKVDDITPQPEVIISPELPICDSHHHLWRFRESSYLLRDFLHDINGGHNILQTVFIESFPLYKEFGPQDMTRIGETQFAIAERARETSKTDVAAGIVANADLCLGEKVAETLEAHIEAGQNRFRSIRFITAWDASPLFKHPDNPRDVMTRSEFRKGFAVLQKYNLSFDAWLYFHQLSELADLAQAFPETMIVTEHIGGILGIGPYAGKRPEVIKEWKRGVSLLAKCPNVYMKLGGLGMESCGFHWSQRAAPPTSTELSEIIAPYYLYCIEKFGTSRCMFESNFPVDKEAYSYTVLWNAFKRLTSDFTHSEQYNLFYGTAIKVYNLKNLSPL